MTEPAKPARGAVSRTISGALIWDLPTRLFHWLLVILFVIAFVTGEESRFRTIHQFAGYGILVLVGFRIIWGVIGGRYARFASFLRSPLAAFAYLKTLVRRDNKVDSAEIGHNPAGGWMVITLLGLLLVQGVTGLFTDDDILFVGPLGEWVSYDQRMLLTSVHRQIGDILPLLIGLHVAAILLYRVVKKQNLVGPMIHGRKPWVSDTEAGPLADRSPPLWRAALAVLAVGGGLWAVLAFAP